MPKDSDATRQPDGNGGGAELLRRLESIEKRQRRGRLKVLLGYSSGVGKSYRLLDEGRRRHERGQDVVVGAIQAKRPSDCEALLQSLEMIPMLGTGNYPHMDVSAILERHPQICLIDGLAWDNPSGATRQHRWQDVTDLLDGGVSVVGTINLQYIAELQGRVEEITGKRTTETVPLSFIYNADEIEVVDAPAVDAADPAAIAANRPLLALTFLRELALVVAAEVVDRQLEVYLSDLGIASQWGAQERILVLLSHAADSNQMLEHAARNVQRFHGGLFAAYVVRGRLNLFERRQLRHNLQVARDAGAEVLRLDCQDAVAALNRLAGERGITQIYLQKESRRAWWNGFAGSFLDRLVEGVEKVDVQIFPTQLSSQ